MRGMATGRSILLWAGLGVFSALAGMMVHELGHVAMAHVMGLKVAEVVWGPVGPLPGAGELSHTFLMDHPRPAAVVWAGFVVGCGLPLVMWAIAGWTRWQWSSLPRFFAGFCLVGNGAYLAAGWLEPTTDGGELARGGVPVWLMVMLGLILVAAGLAIWHRLGELLGVGPHARPVGWSVVIGAWCATGALCVGQWWLNWRG